MRLSALFVVVAIVASAVFADDVVCELNGNVLTIKGNGKMESMTCEVDGSAVESVVIEKGVEDVSSFISSLKNVKTVTVKNEKTEFLPGAFFELKLLTSVTVEGSVTRIGQNAFNGCESLLSVTGWKSIENIENSAFIGCSGLKRVFIPSTVKEIGSQVFYGCESLEMLAYGGDKDICKNDDGETISFQLFEKCYNLTRVMVPETYQSDKFCGVKVKKLTSSAVRSTGSVLSILILVCILLIF